jgi:hypothetical protein
MHSNPITERFSFLKEKMSKDPNCELHCCGLADTPGKAQFYVNKDDATSSLASLENATQSKERWQWPGLQPAATI